MASDDRGSRILLDLNAAFKKDPQIDEYDVIKVLEPKQNKSPLVLTEHKLGLELWSVKLLYEYAYQKLLAWRKKQASCKVLGCDELRSLSRAVILVNPECATAWNIRKELVGRGELRIAEDLKLGCLVLTKHPKSPETFSHRKWLLSRLKAEQSSDLHLSKGHRLNGEVGTGVVSVNSINVHIQGAKSFPQNNHVQPDTGADYLATMSRELRVCAEAASRYPSNYNAWSHRIWLVQHCYQSSPEVCESELSATEGWVSLHVSDHSGFHYRQFLLSALAAASGERTQDRLAQEMTMISDLLSRYMGHEALWYHRKYVFHSILRCASSKPYGGCRVECVRNGVAVERNQLEERESDCWHSLKKTRLENDTALLCVREVDSVNQLERKAMDGRQRQLAERYVKWIEQVYL